MGLLDKLFNRGEKKSVPFSFFYNSGIMANIVTRGDALDFYKSWVYACVTKRSMAIAGLDFHLYKLQGDKVVEMLEHPILDLLYKVNPEMTKFNFLQLSMIYKDLLGASPWVLEGGDKNGRNPKMMYVARPEFFKAEKDKDGKVIKYVYQIGTYKKEFTPEQVIFLKNYNPQNPDKGIGIIEAVRMTAENDDYIVQTNNNLLTNGAVPGGYLETEEVLDDKEIKRLTKKARAKYAGFENAYKVQILQGGMKFKPNIIPPRDMEFIEGRKFNRDEIAGVFGVPKSLLTFDDVNLASAKTGEYQFAKWTLEPLAKEICEQLNEFLVPKFDGGELLYLDFEPIAKDDEEVEIRGNEAAYNKWKTTNEIRESQGLAPLDGGDYIYLPIMSVPTIGQKSAEQTIVKIGSARAVERRLSFKRENYIKMRILNRNQKTNQLIKSVTETAVKKLNNVVVKSFRIVNEKQKKNFNLTNEQIETFYKARMSQEEMLEKKWQSEFKKFFKSQQERFIDAIEKSGKSVATEYGIDTAKELASTIEIINPLMYETLMTGVKQASDLIGQPTIADLDFLREWLDKVSEEIGQTITDTTINAFNETVRAGVEAGESVGDISKRVREVFSFASKTRAEMIARTETARGVTEAHRQTYDYYGFYEVKWLLAPGSCALCEDKARSKWTIDNIKGEIPVHPQCKCDFTPISGSR